MFPPILPLKLKGEFVLLLVAAPIFGLRVFCRSRRRVGVTVEEFGCCCWCCWFCFEIERSKPVILIKWHGGGGEDNDPALKFCCWFIVVVVPLLLLLSSQKEFGVIVLLLPWLIVMLKSVCCSRWDRDPFIIIICIGVTDDIVVVEGGDCELCRADEILLRLPLRPNRPAFPTGWSPLTHNPHISWYKLADLSSSGPSSEFRIATAASSSWSLLLLLSWMEFVP